MKYLEKMPLREFQMIVAGAVMLVVAAVVSLLVMPQLKAWRAAVQSHALLESLPQHGDISHQFALIAADIEQLKQSLHGELGNLPVKEMEAYIVGQLQNISSGHDVHIVGVSPGEREEVEGFHELGFNINVTGGYEDLYDWLVAIDEKLGFVVVKEYQMSILSRDALEPDLRASLTVASYRSVQ